MTDRIHEKPPEGVNCIMSPEKAHGLRRVGFFMRKEHCPGLAASTIIPFCVHCDHCWTCDGTVHGN